ncbi:Short-chain dehydrogenase/reductase SDR [Penicillium cataractarum]|uniref:Short-chain dehydrogenase/reductase SDR n=1 Tax=Penicillium cataractarum TaxID=2100454 RepID=A0A9W9V788_9EURO|nr:Short-chain dehydrogenase/reductase SDR [Penicillium cataractarum]KAJ5371337.1 Short-chain dehydrogenase/reductase SDR [Penicillium cataractarum]
MSAPQYVLITGCSDGGIGASLALAFQRRGFHVIATARSVKRMSTLESVANVTLLPLDVTSPTSMQDALKKTVTVTGGKLHYLVNNSGVSYVMPTLDTSIEEAKKMFDVNLWGVLAMTQAFNPLLIKAQGCVVNIASMTAYLNAPYWSLYAASKAALSSMSETLRLEYAPFGVRVVTVVTGAVETNIMSHGDGFALPDGSMYRPVFKNIEDVARGKSLSSWLPVETYAERVLKDLMGGAHGKIWRGGLSSTMRLISSLPGFIMVGLFSPVTIQFQET